MLNVIPRVTTKENTKYMGKNEKAIKMGKQEKNHKGGSNEGIMKQNREKTY